MSETGHRMTWAEYRRIMDEERVATTRGDYARGQRTITSRAVRIGTFACGARRLPPRRITTSVES